VLIDCDTCTVRGQGCDDCVVTVLLGAPPGWRTSDPTVVPLTRRPAPQAGPAGATAHAGGRRGTGAAARPAADRSGVTGDPTEAAGDTPGRPADRGDVRRVDTTAGMVRPVVELDDVERRAVRALADFGLVPPLRHQDASTPRDRHVS
jgi:hypothetical protein